MTTTFHAILLGLGLLAIGAWLMVQLKKMQFGVVTNRMTKVYFNLETKFAHFVTYLILISSLGILMGAVIRLMRGV